MLEPSIMELINRRRNTFRQRSRLANDAQEAGRNSLIAQEYDALVAEIEDLDHLKSDAHAAHPSPKWADDPSEEWILGDQGQLGG